MYSSIWVAMLTLFKYNVILVVYAGGLCALLKKKPRRETRYFWRKLKEMFPCIERVLEVHRIKSDKKLLFKFIRFLELWYRLSLKGFKDFEDH